MATNDPPKTSDGSSHQDKDLESRILGTLYGNCIGDAIGLLTEFMVKKEAEKYYTKHLNSPQGLQFEQKVPDMHRARWENGDWTDDSDQMILIMDSLLKRQQIDAVDYGQKLINWARHGYQELGDYGGMGIGATTHHVLHHEKYVTNPHEAAKDIWEKTGCYVAPNGAVMRTSVLGLYQYDNLQAVINNTLDICKVTHADPRCQASCVATVCAIAYMLQKQQHHMKKDGTFDITKIVEDSYTEACKVFPLGDKSAQKEYCKELKEYTVKVENLKSLKLDEHNKIGYTYKTLGAGFWALKQNDYRKALTDITMEAGDADTNGAVAGALLGCKLGVDGLPRDWLDSLKYKVWLDNRIVRFMKFAFPKLQSTMVKELPFTLATTDEVQQQGEGKNSEDIEEENRRRTNEID